MSSRCGAEGAVTWDPRSADVLADQRSAYDDLRQRCPIAHSDYLGWSVLRQAEVREVLADHDTFSNRVSQHLSVPSGMDPPEHTKYRRLIEPYFGEEQMEWFAPICDQIAARLVGAVPRGRPMEVIGGIAEEFAVEVQCAFMGWSRSLHDPLRAWMRDQQRATLAQDREQLTVIAARFDDVVRAQLDERRAAGADAPDDPTTRLLRERIDGSALSEDEIFSIIRNWTVGELGTIAASIGSIIAFLAERPEVQATLRADRRMLIAAADEILRIDAPLIANRRVTTRPVTLAGTELPEGARVTVLWASANRDENVIGDPDEFRLDRDPDTNLLYGAGIHVCPGAPLARLELRSFLDALLAGTDELRAVAHPAPVRAVYPAGGYQSVWVLAEGHGSTVRA